MSDTEEPRRVSDLRRYALERLTEQGKLDEIVAEAIERHAIAQARQWREDARDRLAGGGDQRPRANRIPLPVEIDAVIQQAEEVTRAGLNGWATQECGAIAPGLTAGPDRGLRCNRLQGHTGKIKHRNRETGFTWWGSAS